MNEYRVIKAISIFFTLVVLCATAKAAAPANDNFASPEIITSIGLAYQGNNSEATKEAAEPTHALNAGGKSVWYKYTATADGYLTVFTTASGFDTTLAVYKGFSLANLYLLAACDDLIPVTNTRSRVTVETRTGDIYYIAVDGHNTEGTVASGNVVVELSIGSVASHDAFANAFNLSSAGGRQSTSNVNATKEAGEPNHALNVGGRSVW
jgi:hypothetical protein